MLRLRRLAASSNPKTKSVTLTLGGLTAWLGLSSDPAAASSEFDILDREAEQNRIDAMYADRSSLSAEDRLRLMWRTNEYGEASPELSFVYEATQASAMIGIIYGSVTESRKALNFFLEKNKHSMFKHPREAQVSLQDRLMLAYFKGGFRWGWRLGLTAFVYASVSQSLAVARNYINPLDHALAGGIMAAVYRFNMGPKGMLGAGLLGSFLGFNGGLCFWLVQYLSGITIEERWAAELEHMKMKTKTKAESIKQPDPRDQILNVAPSTLSAEEEDLTWVRRTVMSLMSWAERRGLISGGEDPFPAADSSKTQQYSDNITSNDK